MAKLFTLGKKERLKSRKAIDELFKKGQRFNVSPLRVFYQPAPTELQLGVAVSTKNFKKAADRNRVKRLLREAWRLQKNELSQSLQASNKGLQVFIVFTDRELPDFKLVFDKVSVVIKKLQEVYQ